MSFPAYPSYRDSGVEWLGAVPTHWEVKPIKAVASVNDEVLAEATDAERQIEYVEISDVQAGAGIKGSTSYSFGGAPSRARRLVRDGDIVVSTVRTYLRAIAQVQNPPENMIVSTGFAVLRPKLSLSRFLGYAVQSETVINKIIAHSTGISYPAINANELIKISLAIPSLAEQASIAKFLDYETARIDTLIEEQQRLIKLLKEKRQAVISHAVTKGVDPTAPLKDSGVEWLGKVPEHWEVLPVRALFRFVKRQHGDDLDVLSVYREYGVISKSSRSDNNNVTPADLSGYQTVYPGDLVVNKMKAWQGSLGVSGLHGITSPDYAVFAPTHTGVANYLHLMLRSQLLPDVYRLISNGIRLAQWRLEPDKFKELKVPFPPIAEQQAISAALTQNANQMDMLTMEAEAGITLLKERRSGLISAAVTGKIDVRGAVETYPKPEPEPA